MANSDAPVPRRNNCGGKLDRKLKRIRHKFKSKTKNQKPKFGHISFLFFWIHFPISVPISSFFPSLSFPYYALKKMCATLCNSVKPNHVERNLVTTVCVLLCSVKPILGNRYVRSRGFIVSEPRETHPRSEIADVTILPCPPLDNLGCPDPHPPP